MTELHDCATQFPDHHVRPARAGHHRRPRASRGANALAGPAHVGRDHFPQRLLRLPDVHAVAGEFHDRPTDARARGLGTRHAAPLRPADVGACIAQGRLRHLDQRADALRRTRQAARIRAPSASRSVRSARAARLWGLGQTASRRPRHGRSNPESRAHE